MPSPVGCVVSSVAFLFVGHDSMGHCIQAIVTSSDTAERLQEIYPQLPLVSASQEFVILPVDADFVDSVTQPRPSQSTETWMLLTDAFHDLLRELSRFGPLAYIETEYFGGVGGQGAAVYSDGMVMMEPEWSDSGPINRALELIGVKPLRRPQNRSWFCSPVNRALKLIGIKRGLLGDRFSTLGLGQYRSNDDLIEASGGTP